MYNWIRYGVVFSEIDFISLHGSIALVLGIAEQRILSPTENIVAAERTPAQTK